MTISPLRLDGVAMPCWIVKYERDGSCASPQTRDESLNAIADVAAPSHVILMSHGWNTDFDDALWQYRAFLIAFEAVARDFGTPGSFRPLFIGVSWPSVWFPLDRGPTIAGCPTAALDSIVDALFVTANAADRAEFGALVARDRLSGAEAAEAAALALSLVRSGPDDEASPAGDEITAEGIVEASVRVQEAVDGRTNNGVIGTVDFNQLRGAFGSSVKAAGGAVDLDPRNLLRLLSLYAMKDRAGAVGSGVAELLRQAVRLGPPVHCIGHSFGAKVILSAICRKEPLDKPVASALLLQPAVSHLCFASSLPGVRQAGGYAHALDPARVSMPIFSTFSRSDFPLHEVYHLAMRRQRDFGEPKPAAENEPPDRWAALGGYGPRFSGETNALIHAPGQAYRLSGEARIIGLDGSDPVDFPKARPEARIECHGCVANPYTAWALYSQMTA